MNPSFNAEGHQLKVCKETEDTFNEEFWTKQNYITYLPIYFISKSKKFVKKVGELTNICS